MNPDLAENTGRMATFGKALPGFGDGILRPDRAWPEKDLEINVSDAIMKMKNTGELAFGRLRGRQDLRPLT